MSATEQCAKQDHLACTGAGIKADDPDFSCDCYCHHVDGEGIPCRECYPAEERAAWRRDRAEGRQ
jgi:hypothetical protein